MHGVINRDNRSGGQRVFFSSWRSTLAWVGSLVFAVSFTGFVHARIPAIEVTNPDEAFVPKPEVARLLSLGFESVVADYYWLKAIQVVGDGSPARHDQGAYLGRLIDLVTSLNPRVSHPYRFAAVWLTSTEADVREANRLLRRGIEYHPEDWRNLFYLGFNQFYYLGENERAADTLAQASALEGSPRYLSRLVARLRAESGGLDVAEGLLREMARNTQDDEVRAGYLEALDEIEIERRARFLDSARESFRKVEGRDIDSVSDLTQSASPILAGLPDAVPSSVSSGPSQGSTWQIDPETDAIVSSYYGRRYAVNFTPDRAVRVRDWQQKKAHTDESSSQERGQ